MHSTHVDEDAMEERGEETRESQDHQSVLGHQPVDHLVWREQRDLACCSLLFCLPSGLLEDGADCPPIFCKTGRKKKARGQAGRWYQGGGYQEGGADADGADTVFGMGGHRFVMGGPAGGRLPRPKAPASGSQTAPIAYR